MSLRIYICCKQVPDVAMPFQIKEGQLIRDGLNYILNAYDASSVEEALVLKAEHGAHITLVLIGPDKAKEALRKGLAMGADDAVHLNDAAFEGCDSHAAAKVLAKFFIDKEYDFILTGKQSQDMDMGLTGGILAHHLNIPYVTNAVGLTADLGAKIASVKRQGDDGQEMIDLPFPCLVTCSNDMNDPRIPSLKGIMGAKKKEIRSVHASNLSNNERVQSIDSVFIPTASKETETIEGDADDIVERIVSILKSEIRVI